VPAISVLIPCYNSERTVAATLESVTTQTFPDWEIICVDDGSEDRSALVVEQCMREQPERQIALVRSAHAGCAAATRIAIQNAMSPICTILDSDDTLLPHALETIIQAFAARPDVGFLWTRYLAVKEIPGAKPRGGRSKPLPAGKTLKEALLAGWWGALAQRAFRLAVYEKTPGLDPSLPYVVDQQLAALFAELGCAVMHVPVNTYVHLQHAAQMSARRYKEQQACRARVLERLGGKYVSER